MVYLIVCVVAADCLTRGETSQVGAESVQPAFTRKLPCVYLVCFPNIASIKKIIKKIIGPCSLMAPILNS